MKSTLLYAVTILTCALLPACNKNESPTGSHSTTAQPDNTAANKVDRNSATTTPMDQGQNSADIKITAEIRRAVMDDNSLSTNAHNAKIVTSNGVVTLRGVVNSAAEKDALELRAKAAAGVLSVNNQLEIKNP